MSKVFRSFKAPFSYFDASTIRFYVPQQSFEKYDIWFEFDKLIYKDTCEKSYSLFYIIGKIIIVMASTKYGV